MCSRMTFKLVKNINSLDSKKCYIGGSKVEPRSVFNKHSRWFWRRWSLPFILRNTARLIQEEENAWVWDGKAQPISQELYLLWILVIHYVKLLNSTYILPSSRVICVFASVSPKTISSRQHRNYVVYWPLYIQQGLPWAFTVLRKCSVISVKLMKAIRVKMQFEECD